MEIKNIQKIKLSIPEAGEIRDVIEMTREIADEFGYTRSEVFETLLDHYDRNEGYVATEIDL